MVETADDNAPVFTSRKGGSLDTSRVHRIVRAAGEWVGVEGVSTHWLRHAHASHALERGAPLGWMFGGQIWFATCDLDRIDVTRNRRSDRHLKRNAPQSVCRRCRHGYRPGCDNAFIDRVGGKGGQF